MKVKILGINYDVKMCNEGELGDGDYIGRIIAKQALIRIDKTARSQPQAELLLHEIIHGIDMSMDTQIKETIIKRLAHGLYAVLIDNPHIFSYDPTGHLYRNSIEEALGR